MQPDIQLYAAHIEELRRRYLSALEQTKLDAVVIAAGTPTPVFLDDQHLPFKANPYLLQWAPLQRHPDSLLILGPGAASELLIYAPPDYWQANAKVPELLNDGPINLTVVTEGRQLVERVKALPSRTAFLGEIRTKEDSFGLRKINPPKLLAALDYQRAVKTEWEVDCMRAASTLAVHGHLAAEEAFRSGGSEYEIQLAFRTACQAMDDELPYPAIVALNEHAAALHYQHLDRQRIHNLSLLIDAGAAHNGYASDITRTYSNDPMFGALIEALHELQRELCAMAQPGADFRDLHIAAHHGIAVLLQEAGLIDMAPEDAVTTTVSRSFFPHGLGHFLGLQVHDVGALLASSDGAAAPRPDSDPYLRLTRILEAGNVLTIEPGLYFVDVLLAELRERPEGRYVNWDAVDELRKFGGIRIEDNLHITATGSENLTRNAFANADN